MLASKVKSQAIPSTLEQLRAKYQAWWNEPTPKVDVTDVDSILEAVLSFDHLTHEERAWYGRQIAQRFGWPIKLVRNAFIESGVYGNR